MIAGCGFHLALAIGVVLPSLPSGALRANSVPSHAAEPQIAGSQQLLLSTAASWDAVSAELRCFERADSRAPWIETLRVPKAVLGRKGLGWGLGLHRKPAGDAPVKREGDERAPAGVFHLVEVFGFASAEEAGVANFPYRHLTPDVEGIDDPASRYYNRLVDGRSVERRDWKSSEQMRAAGEVYRWGVVVGHNWDQVSGAGSCIFLHIWERPGEGTSGCTAMPAEQLRKVIRWLDQRKQPILVQLPEVEYRRVRELWGLP